MCQQTDVLWPMVSALIACASVIVSLLIAAWQSGQTRIANSAKMTFDYVNKFESDEWRLKRAEFSKKLVNSRKLIDLKEDCPVLDFFEEVAFMTRRKILDNEMVFNSFAWWILPYYGAIIDNPNLLDEARGKDGPLDKYLYCETERLFKELSKKYGVYSKEQIAAFLNSEIEQGANDFTKKGQGK